MASARRVAVATKQKTHRTLIAPAMAVDGANDAESSNVCPTRARYYDLNKMSLSFTAPDLSTSSDAYSQPGRLTPTNEVARALKRHMRSLISYPECFRSFYFRLGGLATKTITHQQATKSAHAKP